MQKWLKMAHFWPKMAQNFFAQKTPRNVRYFSILGSISGILRKSGRYLVNILGKSGQYSGQCTDFFLQTTVVITDFHTVIKGLIEK